MKPLYLEFCGINSFSERAEINFADLLSYGIFGIFGDTGSGKSTILDCISFALYGRTGRVGRSVGDLINYKSERAFVNFVFEIVYEGERRAFRVERELKKNKQNNGHVARVYEKKDETLYALSANVSESNELLERIIGLEFEDFEKCIALPQGEFAQFVKAARGERLKLISHLFGLEKYGTQLVTKINNRYQEAKSEQEILLARGEQYEGVSEQVIAQLEQTLAQTRNEEERKKSILEGAREREKTLSRLLERQEEAQRVTARLSELEAEKAQIHTLAAELNTLEQATALLALSRQLREATQLAEGATRQFNEAEAQKISAEQLEKEINKQMEAGDFDGEIERLTAQYTNASRAEDIRKRLLAAQKRLAEAREKYRKEKEQRPPYSKEEKEGLQTRRAALGEGDFSAFLEGAKQGLFGEEYAIFAKELTSLTQRYAQIEKDTAPLIEKYVALSRNVTSGRELIEQYRAQEQTRKELDKKISDCEIREERYAAHGERLARIKADGEQASEEVKALEEELAAYGGESAEIVKQKLVKVKDEKNRLNEESKRLALARERAVEGFMQAQAKLSGAETLKGRLAAQVEESLREGNFQTVEGAEALVRKHGNPQDARARVEKFNTDYAVCLQKSAELSQYAKQASVKEELTAVRENVKLCENALEELSNGRALAQEELTKTRLAWEKKRELEKALQAARKRADIFEKLKKLTANNKFIEFVAEEYLQSVAAGASGRILSLTDGRYFLRYEEGSFAVGDNFNGGASRGVHTLSGGETFLVSLSLALALSGEICAKSLRPIEFFFLDEGFGTLDGRLVDTVIDSLEKLKNEYFSIGLISHVEELKHRLIKKLTVVKASEKKGSQIYAE